MILGEFDSHVGEFSCSLRQLIYTCVDLRQCKLGFKQVAGMLEKVPMRC